MKTTCLILLSALSLSAFAQNIPGDCSITTGEEKERNTTYTVDANNDTVGMNVWQYQGNIAEWVYMSKEKGKWVFRNRSQRTFDDKGNLLSNMYQEFKNHRWVNRYYELYSYNSRNNKNEYLLLEFKGKKWHTISGERTTYNYSADNTLADITYELWNRDAWIKDWRTEFVYDRNILTCSYDYEYKENEWKPVFKNEYDWYKWEGNVTASVLRSLNSFQEQDGNWIMTKRPHSKRNSSPLITYN